MSSLLSLLIVVIIIASSSYSVMDRVFQDQGRVPASFAQLASIQEMQDFKIQQYANVLNISPEEFYYSNHYTLEEAKQDNNKAMALMINSLQLLKQNKDTAL